LYLYTTDTTDIVLPSICTILELYYSFVTCTARYFYL